MSEAIRRHGARNEWRPRDTAGFAALLVAIALADRKSVV